MSTIKRLGITRKIDSAGRVTLPSVIRNELDMKPGKTLEFFREGDVVLLRVLDIREEE